MRSKRTVEQIKTFCEVMSMEDGESTSEWQRGYMQAMEDVLLYIEKDGVVMVKLDNG
jgi:hypothetical protein